MNQVLIITPIYPPEIGGPATYVPEIAKRLKAHVVTFSNQPSSETVTTVSLKGNSLTRQLRLLLAVSRHLRPVLYIQGTIVVGLTAFLGKLLGKKVVIKFVGDEVWESDHSTDTPEEFYAKPHDLKTGLMIWLHRQILKTAHAIVVPSAYLKDFLVTAHHLNPERITVIPNALELPTHLNLRRLEPGADQAEPRRLTPGNAYHLIFVGRLVPWKHVDEIIKAVHLARKQHPWNLTIVGAGPERSKLAKLLGGEWVTFTGQLPKPETLRLLSQSQALILYSTYEGHPHTVLEAHALGIKTIVSDIPPHRDLGCFAMVPIHNSTALAAAINTLPQQSSWTPPPPPTWEDHMDKLRPVLSKI